MYTKTLHYVCMFRITSGPVAALAANIPIYQLVYQNRLSDILFVAPIGGVRPLCYSILSG